MQTVFNSDFRIPFKNRSKSCNRDLKKMANIGDDHGTGSLSGYDASGSEVSSLARDAHRMGSRRRWFAHYDTQSTSFEFVNLSKLLQKNSRRSVIASGASAAVFNSALESEVGSEDELKRLQNTITADHGDGRNNSLVRVGKMALLRILCFSKHFQENCQTFGISKKCRKMGFSKC